MRTKTLIIALITFLVSFNSFSQNSSRKKIKALKVAFITEELNLTENEAIKFWPVYNNFEKKLRNLYSTERRKLRKEIEQLGSVDNLSESQAKTITDKMLASEKAEYYLQLNYYKELRNVISNLKIIKLQNAERAFNRKLFSQYGKQRSTNSKNKKRN